MLSILSLRLRRVALALLALWMMLSPLGQFTPAQAQVAPASVPDTFVFEQVVTEGQDGFSVAYSVDGIDGRMLLGGTRNGEQNLWVLENGSFTAVLPANGVLPDGLGTVSAIGTTRMTANGDVILRVGVSGGTLAAGSYAIRWRNGVVTLAQPSGPEFTHHFDNPNYGQPVSDGRWLVSKKSGVFPTQSFQYSFTDGATVTPFVTLSDTAVISTTSTGFTGWCTRIDRQLLDANANGVYAYVETSFVNDPCAPINPTRPSNWSIKLGGAVEATLLTGSYTFMVGQGVTGVFPDMQRAILSDANELLFVRQTRNPSATPKDHFEVVIVDQAGNLRVIFDSFAPPESLLFGTYAGLVSYFDAQGRVAAVGQLGGAGGPYALMTGNDFSNDVVLKVGDPLFGDTLLTLQPSMSVHQTSGASENRVFLMNYLLANGVKGILRVSRPKPRWANAAGGEWSKAANWTPATVPAANAQVTFGPPTTYDVQVGSHEIGSIAVEQGSVRFVAASLQVSTDGALTVIGATNGPVPRLTVGQGRAVSGTQQFDSAVLANVTVGPGELLLTNAAISGRATGQFAGFGELGVLGPATATVTGGAEWKVQALVVGASAPSQLRVEDGGWIGPVDPKAPMDELWIGGFAGSTGTTNQASAVRVDGASGNAGPRGLGAFIGPVDQMVVGQQSPGALEVVNGGSVGVVTVTVGTRDHGALVDGTLTVDGTNSTGQSLLEAGRDVLNDGGLFVATEPGTRAEVNLFNGGAMTATQLILAEGPQSSALMFVDGLEPSDGGTRPSSFVAPFPKPVGLPQTPNLEAGTCVVGFAGQGTLNVSNGGLMQCRLIAVGFASGSRGELFINGAFRSILPRVAAVGIGAPTDGFNGSGLVCVGRVPLCGSNTGTVRGDVALGPDAILQAALVVIGPGGRILGNGTILTSADLIVAGGTLAPGVLDFDGARVASSAETDASDDLSQLSDTSAVPSAGTLTIQGNLTLSNTSVISVQVLGPNAPQQDRIVVTGAATLGGELVINFANGFLPSEGNQFGFLQANTSSGSFAKVTVVGLPPEFKFNIGSTGGDVTFTVTDDGDPNTSPSFKTYLPMIDR